MSWEEAIAEQARLFSIGQFFSIHQEHDDIGRYYLMPSSRAQVEYDIRSRV